MPGFLALFSLNFCIGGLPLPKRISNLFRESLFRRASYFAAGMACGFFALWTARFLVGTAAAEYFAATGLLAGRLFFPLKRWRQEDLRGVVVGTLLLLAPGLLLLLIGGWIIFYLLTREVITGTFLGTLLLLPVSLHYYESDLLFLYIFIVASFFLAENMQHFEGREDSRVAAAICFLPHLYRETRGLRRAVNFALLSAVFLLLTMTAYLYRMVYTGSQQAAVFSSGNVEEKIAALTFDDGPDPRYTGEILDILKEKGAPATFFVVGTQAERYPDILRRCIEEGHEIGSHTYTHANLYHRNSGKVEFEMSRNREVIKGITGQAPQYFRPPRGLYDERILSAGDRLEQRIILWSISGEDWMEPSAKHIVRRISQKIHPGAIILLHDSGGLLHNYGGDRSSTVSALGQIIDSLRRQGYRFVTVGELLEADHSAAAG